MAGDNDEEVMYGILFRFVISFLNLAEIDERTNQKDKKGMNFSSLNAGVASSVVINEFRAQIEIYLFSACSVHEGQWVRRVSNQAVHSRKG